MLTSFCLLTLIALFAQPRDQRTGDMTIRLARGQELVYQGTYLEQSLGRETRGTRTFHLESRVFVLNARTDGYDLAFYTILKLQDDKPGHGDARIPASIRLDLARLDPQGRLTSRPEGALVVPLNGPPTAEAGQFVEVPRSLLEMNQTWQVSDGGRPIRSWKFGGFEFVSGLGCIKLQGTQLAPEWAQPRADQIAWKRQDFVWTRPGVGIAYRVRRVIELKEPAHLHPTQRSTLEYDLQSSMIYPGQLFESRRRDILQAIAFNDSVAPYLPSAGSYGRKPFEDFLLKIQHYLDNQPRTPYREAILQVQRRVDAARRGESPPSLAAEARTQGSQSLILGERAPDFIATNVTTHQTVELRQLLGRPTLMVFYNPRSLSVEEVLHSAQRLQDAYPRRINVLAFPINDATQAGRRQQADFYLHIPILASTGLKQSYNVEATPKLVILDANAVARASFDGWGPETASAVQAEFRRWLPGEHGEIPTSRQVRKP
jgi:hypothetical protein